MIKQINKFRTEFDGRRGIVEFSGTKKQLEEYYKADVALGGSFRPMRMLDRIRKDGNYFNYLKIDY